ncbi:hypothetical protein [Paenibacillus xylaniclasticus]|uniref:hypothetical protein n=1 Tax=Paenibacillus xylaniclasticus TaxID=588083 RepID=UPI000FDBCE75|nr:MULTISPECIES: hypothetical protein [Paenibacillus]GFN33031.1 hypothetical protein PCURB6_32910 [Paenibacillus curdlanolyticus]
MENNQSGERSVVKDKFFVTVQAIDYYGATVEQFEMLLDRGTTANVGDCIELFKKQYGLDTELKNVSPYMEFKVIEPQPKGIRQFTVLRIVKDYTYQPVTKL